jgi:hypothetical protein
MLLDDGLRRGHLDFAVVISHDAPPASAPGSGSARNVVQATVGLGAAEREGCSTKLLEEQLACMAWQLRTIEGAVMQSEWLPCRQHRATDAEENREADIPRQGVNGGSPTLFATDRDTYVVQGWRVPNQDLSVEIPSRPLAFLEEGTRLAVTLEDTGRGSYILSGAAIDDPEALAQMDIPGHETAVEVGKMRREHPSGSVEG